MKRIISILFAALLLLPVSCVKELSEKLDGQDAEPRVPIIMSFEQPVVLQAGTKAVEGMEMGVNPAISSIHVAVFGSSHYLKDYTSAMPCDASGNILSSFSSDASTTGGVEGTYYFIVRLPISTDERYVHIIANGPSSLSFNAYENTLMQNLSVSDGNGAYWQRLYLPDGIRAEVDPITGLYIIDSANEYSPTATTTAAFSNIKLVRNFASVTVSETAANFELLSYTLCNMPESGSVAIWSTNHGDWVDNYSDKTIDSNGLITWTKTGESTPKTYVGYPANPVLDTDIPETASQFDAAGVAVGAGESIYVYERAVTNSAAPFILMKAKWVESLGSYSTLAEYEAANGAVQAKYYRLDITHKDAYIPLYRNYKYDINITEVAVGGFDKPGQAAKHNSGDSFSFSMDTQALADVANSQIRLIVSQPYYDLVYSEAQQSFKFSFAKSDGTPLNGNVSIELEEGGNAIKNTGAVYWTVSSSDVTETSGLKTRTVSYYLNDPGTSELSSTFKLIGTLYETDGVTVKSRLSRRVNIRTFNPESVTLTLTPDVVAPEADQPTTLGIKLPSNFTQSMFPMEILIEDSSRVLNPASTESMPVRVAKSIIDGTSNSYYFVRTLNWSEYARIKKNAELSETTDLILNCDFVTTKAFTSTTVYVQNEYFAKTSGNNPHVLLDTDSENMITPASKTIKYVDDPSFVPTHTVTVKSEGAWTLSITLNNGETAGGVTFSPSSGATATSGETVSITFPKNETDNAISYKLVLHNTEDDIYRTASATVEGVGMSLSTNSTSVAHGTGSTLQDLNVIVSSATSYKLQVLTAASEVIYNSLDYGDYYAPTSGKEIKVVKIPVNETVTDRLLTIRMSNASGSLYRDVQVTQLAGTASLTVVDDEIPMSQTSATVNVASTSFDTVLKVIRDSDNAEVFSQSIPANESLNQDYAATTGANSTGLDRTFTVQLCNTSGTVIRTGTITQFGTPMLTLTPATNDIGNGATDVSLTLVSEAAWTISAPGVTVTPSIGSATGLSVSIPNITVSVPANNVLVPVTYTITADNGSHSRIATINQAAGTATLTVTDANIMMSQTSARINVAASFDTVVKVYDDPAGAPLFTSAVTHSSGTTVTATGLGMNTPGSDRIFTVKLFNTDDVLISTGTITQSGTPVLTITPTSGTVSGNTSSIAGNVTSATFEVVSDMPWTLALSGGSGTPSFSPASGSPTGPTAVSVTLSSMPINYSLNADVVYTVEVTGSQSSTSLTESINITQRHASPKTGQTATFGVLPGSGSGLYSTSDLTETISGITAEFNQIDGTYGTTGGTAYLNLLSSGTTLHFTRDNEKVITITKVVFTFTAGIRAPSSVTDTYASGTGSITGTGSTTTWQGDATEFTLEFYRNNLSLRLHQFVVTYTGYQWD